MKQPFFAKSGLKLSPLSIMAGAGLLAVLSGSPSFAAEYVTAALGTTFEQQSDAAKPKGSQSESKDKNRKNSKDNKPKGGADEEDKSTTEKLQEGFKAAKEAALETTWEPDTNAKPYQTGTIIYEFHLRKVN